MMINPKLKDIVGALEEQGDEKWHAYRHAALEKIARDWCERHGIGYLE